ncbi:hypothetical protein [Nostoc sp.]|uniref:hypothetical protein n=1 Tax=Nostoc sp. TaxID=1180 RepID=UPI002FF4CFC6
MSSRTARSYAFLSIAAAIVTIVLKFGAYLLTGSVGLLSDAIESCVNLVAACGGSVGIDLCCQTSGCRTRLRA